jgi:PST family polysaccharide transporter
MLKKQILRGAAWLLLGRFVSQTIGLVSTLVAAHLLVPADFGLVAVAMSVFIIAGAVVELPVAAALVQLNTVTDRDFDTAWTLNIIRGGIVAVLMLVAAWPVAAMFGDARLSNVICALAVYPLVLGFRNSRFEMFIRNMDFKWEAMVEVGTKVASFAVMFWVAYATGSYWALPLSLIASGVIALVMSFALCPKVPGLSLSEFRKFFGFSVWLGLAHIADSLRDAATSLFVGKSLGHATLGTYSVGMQFADRMELFLYAPMERTMFAAFSSIQEDLGRVRAAYLSSLHASFAITLPICIGIGLLANEIVAMTLGEEWTAAALVLAFAAPTTAIYLLGAISVSIATALGRTKSVFWLKLTAACIYVPLMMLGALQFGMVGVLTAGAITAAVWCALSFRLIAAVIHVTLLQQVAAVARSLAAAIVMAGAVVWVRLNVFDDPGLEVSAVMGQASLLALLGAAVYFSAHIGLWMMASRPDGVERLILTRMSPRATS